MTREERLEAENAALRARVDELVVAVEAKTAALSEVAQTLAGEYDKDTVGLMVRRCFEIIEPAYKVQPCTEALNKVRAEAVRAWALYEAGEDHMPDMNAYTYALRVEKGEA